MIPKTKQKIKLNSNKIILSINTCPCKDCADVKANGYQNLNPKILEAFKQHSESINKAREAIASKSNDCMCAGCSEIKKIGVDAAYDILKSNLIKALGLFNQHSALIDGTLVKEGDVIEWVDSDGSPREDKIQRGGDGSLFMVNDRFHIWDYKSAKLGKLP